MKLLLATFFAIHGLIHLLGVVKAFRPAALPTLVLPVSPALGVMWLAGATLFLATAVALVAGSRLWWAVGATGVIVSTVAIAPSWADAKAGMLVNLVALAPIAVGLLATGPVSLQAEYTRDVRAHVASPAAETAVTEADLAPLPDPVRRYLRAAGVVGQPRVRNVRARMHGRLRSASNARWMPFTAEQHNTFVGERTRLCYIQASMFAVPIYGYHRYEGASAAMLVKALGLVPVARLSGDEATRTETVTMFNDMCLLAPATLIDPSIAWEPVDDLAARAAFTNAGHTIRAELVFNAAGDLVDFRSDDRGQAGAQGRLHRLPWSTPVRSYRAFGAFRLMSGGEARWHEPSGAWTYIEVNLDDVAYNVPTGGR